MFVRTISAAVVFFALASTAFAYDDSEQCRKIDIRAPYSVNHINCNKTVITGGAVREWFKGVKDLVEGEGGYQSDRRSAPAPVYARICQGPYSWRYLSGGEPYYRGQACPMDPYGHIVGQAM